MGDGGRERRARQRAEQRARDEAARFEREMRATEEANERRLNQMQAQNREQQAIMEQTMQANVQELTRTPTTIRRKKRKSRRAAGRDRLRIAMEQKGTSTNLG
jgi:hypothetical protein